MALSKITYANKSALNPQPSIAEENKVTDANMNEIKSVVNDAIDQVDANTAAISNMSVDIEYEVPTKTGRRFKVNGVWKDEYIYYKNVGNLPNNTSASYETSISKSSITMVTNTGGTAYSSSVGNFMTLNGVRPQNNASGVSVQSEWSNNNYAFYIETAQDRSGWIGTCWVTYY